MYGKKIFIFPSELQNCMVLIDKFTNVENKWSLSSCNVILKKILLPTLSLNVWLKIVSYTNDDTYIYIIYCNHDRVGNS